MEIVENDSTQPALEEISSEISFEYVKTLEIRDIDPSQPHLIPPAPPRRTTSISGDSTKIVSSPKCVLDSVTWIVQLNHNELQFFECAGESEQSPRSGPAFKYALSKLLFYKIVGLDLQLQFVTPDTGHRYKLAKPLKITGFASDQHLYQWVQQLGYLDVVKRRPRNLVFLVNPMSGKKNSRKYFSKTVEPMLKTMGITYLKYETEHRGHATEICRDLQKSSIDGIVILGGDGTANEAIYGLADLSERGLGKSCKMTTRVGIIPCGTSNNLCHAVHGTDDRLTALLHILLGHNINVDMMTTWVPGMSKMVGIAMTMVAYGFIADSIKESESFRKLPGTLGYTVSFVKSIQKMRKYPGILELSIASPEDTTPYNSPPCKSKCSHCIHFPDQDPSTSEKLTYTEERFFGIQIHNHSGICEMAPRGASSNAHLGDGCMDVLITRDLKQKEAVAMLKDVGKKEGTNLPFDFVEAVRVNQVTFKADESSPRSCWILDGEVIEEPELTVCMHKQAVAFFGRGIEPDNSMKNGCMRSFCGCS